MIWSCMGLLPSSPLDSNQLKFEGNWDFIKWAILKFPAEENIDRNKWHDIFSVSYDMFPWQPINDWSPSKIQNQQLNHQCNWPKFHIHVSSQGLRLFRPPMTNISWPWSVAAWLWRGVGPTFLITWPYSKCHCSSPVRKTHALSEEQT